MKCPICNNEYPRLLALSRRDNKTMICDECGMSEAFEDLLGRTVTEIMNEESEEKKTMLTGVYVNPWNAEIRKIYFKDNLEEFYRLLECSCIDITTRRINGVPVSIICDDEGLLKQNIVSAVDNEQNPMLVGNLLIVSAKNIDGNLVSLDEQEIRKILESTLYGVIKDPADDSDHLIKVVNNVDYL